MDDYNIAIDFDPTYHTSLFNRAILKSELGDYSGSVEDYTEALIFAKSSKYFYERGKANSKLENHRIAILDFSQAISKDKEFVNALLMRGVSKFKIGDKFGACNDWKKAIDKGSKEGAKFVEKYCGFNTDL